MKTIRKEYPRVREYKKSGNRYFAVDLRRKHYKGPAFKNFTDSKMALEYAADIAEKVSKSGLDSISRYHMDPRLVAWTEQFAIYNKTLEEGIQMALELCESQRKVKESPFMSELLTLWVDDKTSNKLKPLRPRTEATIRQMAFTFKTDFADTRIKEMDHARIETYLQNKNVSNQTRENTRNYLGQFFNWCIRKQYFDKNPAEHVEIHIARTTPKFFNVNQCVKLMEQAGQKEHRPVTAYFALCLFAGIRPEEAQRMEWANINLETKEVFIPHFISKTKRDRMFVMSENLHSWLTLCKLETTSLIPVNFRKLKDLALKSLGFEWIQDACRRSFATFHYAKHKNIETLRHVMGNSPEIIDRFYKGVIPKSEVKLFWSITPDSQPVSVDINKTTVVKEVLTEPRNCS